MSCGDVRLIVGISGEVRPVRTPQRRPASGPHYHPHASFLRARRPANYTKFLLSRARPSSKWVCTFWRSYCLGTFSLSGSWNPRVAQVLGNRRLLISQHVRTRRHRRIPECTFVSKPAKLICCKTRRFFLAHWCFATAFSQTCFLCDESGQANCKWGGDGLYELPDRRCWKVLCLPVPVFLLLEIDQFKVSWYDYSITRRSSISWFCPPLDHVGQRLSWILYDLNAEAYTSFRKMVSP